MALKAIVDSLDAIPEAHQALYVKMDDGRFKLDAEGVEDVSGLKSALEKEREDRRKARQELEKFKNVDPEKYAELVKLHEDIESKELLAKGDVDKVVENRVKQMKEKFEGEIQNLTGTNKSLLGRLEALLIDTEVQREAIPLVLDTAMDDVVRRAREVFRIVDGHAVPMQGDKVIYGSDGVTPLTMKEWLAGLAKTAPHLYKGSQGGGAGGNGGGRGTGGGADLSKLPPAERLKVVRRQGQS